MKSCSVVDLFCGVGGLTHGLELAGLNVVAGIDINETCKFAYEGQMSINLHKVGKRKEVAKNGFGN